jgi:GNAT superfamily N-acetyltransferase
MMCRSEPEDLFTKSASFFKRRAQLSSLHAVHLQWVAVETDLQRSGIGTLLMGSAIEDFYQIADRTGIAALTLTPISNAAASFYGSLGFITYGSGDLPPMFLPAETVIRARESSGQ